MLPDPGHQRCRADGTTPSSTPVTTTTVGSLPDDGHPSGRTSAVLQAVSTLGCSSGSQDNNGALLQDHPTPAISGAALTAQQRPAAHSRLSPRSSTEVVFNFIQSPFQTPLVRMN
ncbi:uncharacterized protein LOC144463519 [Epinephelus lanceolatus]